MPIVYALSVAMLSLTIVASVSAADLDTVRNRAVELYRGSGGGAGVDEIGGGIGEARKRALAHLHRRAERLLGEQAEWPDLASAAQDKVGEKVTEHYRNILVLSQAYVAPGSEDAGAEKLKARIESELRNGLKFTAKGTPRPGNWFHWLIATPQALGPTLLLVEGKIDAKLYDECLVALADLAREPHLSGANAVWEGRNHLYLGLLQRDEKRIDRAMQFLSREISVSEGGSGILEDYSFQFHGRLLHTSGYGGGFAYSCAEAAYLCDGTKWAIAKERVELLAKHLIEHARWVIWKGTYDLSVRGRGVLKEREGLLHLDALLLLKQIKPAGLDERTLRSAVLSFSQAEDATSELTVAGLVDALQVREQLQAWAPGYRHFYATDVSVYRTKDWYASVRMYSDRLIDYEGNWNTNLTGWFLAYGLTYFTRSGDELWRDGAIASKGFDWDRLPGTTTRVGVHPAKAYNTGTSNFAGGAGGGDAGSGGMSGFILKPAAGDFVARKSYFFCPDGFVAMGSGITSTAAHDQPVVTTVTQWATGVPKEPVILSGGREVAAGAAEASYDNVDWAMHDNVRYEFFEPTKLFVRHTGNLVTLWIDHGHAPKDANYAYMVLPAGAPRTMVRIVRHDATGHAVEWTTQNRAHFTTTGVVFWQAGEAAGISAHAPAVVFRDPGSKTLSVTNPLHTLATLNVSMPFHRQEKDLVGPREMKLERSGDTLQVNVQTSYGRVYRAGGGEVSPQPREDIAAYRGFAAEVVELKGNVVTLDVKLPDPARKGGYELLVRGPQGHLRAELTDADITGRPAEGVVRYRWERKPTEKPNERTFGVQLFHGLH